MTLRPFFRFYGGKWRSAPHYPPPTHATIVEPFAGSAGYALRYPDRRVVLVERDPFVAGTWRYLLRVSADEVRALPDLEIGQSVDDLRIPQEARWLIGWWLNSGSAQPKKRFGAWTQRVINQEWGPTTPFRIGWGAAVRNRIADQLDAVRHWRLVEGDYSDAPNIDATWFVDPPYEVAGKHYRHGSAAIRYPDLAAWCRARRGQVIVCENTGASWLPFRHLRDVKASEAAHGGKVSREAIFETTDAATLLAPLLA